MRNAATADEKLDEADVVVVGSGPVGLKIALDLADAGMKVLLIESGRDGNDRAAQSLSDAEIANPQTHAPMSVAVKRAFGGTSNLWGGRAVPLDTIDFAARPYAPHTQWPIALSEIERWYESACRFLDCGPAKFTDDALAALEQGADGLTLRHLERWCANPRMRAVHAKRMQSHPNLRVALGTTALRFDISESGVRALVVSRDGEGARVTARSYIVAAGGLETARLLLVSRMANPELFGGAAGALGRFYMGHIFGAIADIAFDRPELDREFLFKRDDSGRYLRRRFALDAKTQLANGILNMVAWPEPPPLDDPRHASGILSMAYLALRAPVLGPMLSPEAIRLRKVGTGPARVREHAVNIAKDALVSSQQAFEFLRARYGNRVRMPGFFVLNGAHRYAFNYHGEHLPSQDSRVLLGKEMDILGQPRLRIDLRFRETDAESIVKTHTLMDARLRAAGIGRLDYNMAEQHRVSAVRAQASDGFHQIGTARMSTSERDGVVDANAKVHGVSNLFLAGSAIFPSSGQANPTLTAVALAARLAQHLQTAQRALPAPALAS